MNTISSNTRAAVGLAAAALLLSSNPSLHGASYTWKGSSGDWQTASNWEPSGVPGPADTAIISGGAVTVSDQVTVAVVELKAGALGGAGTLTIKSELLWSGASTLGSGGTTVIAPGAVATLSGAGNRDLNGQSLVNQGTLVHTGTSVLRFAGGARLENQAGGVVDLQADVNWTHPNPATFINTGTFRKSGATGASDLGGLTPANSGRFEVLAGTLVFSGGVTGTGTFHAAAEAQARYQGTVTLADAVFSGPGTQRLENGGQFTGTQRSENLEWTAGALSGTSTWEGLLLWSGGSVDGPGTLTVGTAGTLRLIGERARDLNSATLVNRGVVVHTGSSLLRLTGGSRVENEVGGLIDLQGDGSWTAPNPATLLNRGTFRKSGGTGTSSVQLQTFTNEGEIAALTGALYFETDLRLGSSTTLRFGLSGTGIPPQHGRLSYSRPMVLTGSLAVVFLEGFVPSAGQQFDVITTSCTGIFQGYMAPLISPTVFINPVYRADGVSLVTTDPTPTISGPRRLASERQFHLKIQGIANLSYVVQGSTDFADWTPLATNAVPASTVWEFIDVESAALPWRFYRVHYAP